MDIVSEASNTDFRSYFDNKVKNSIGMDGTWNYGLIYRIYYSTARSMARFGLLLLNKGEWGNEQIINENFLNECLNSSQNLNPSYGYLTWLNGKAKFMIPGSQTVFPGFLVPNARRYVCRNGSRRSANLCNPKQKDGSCKNGRSLSSIQSKFCSFRIR